MEPSLKFALRKCANDFSQLVQDWHKAKQVVLFRFFVIFEGQKLLVRPREGILNAPRTNCYGSLEESVLLSPMTRLPACTIVTPLLSAIRRLPLPLLHSDSCKSHAALTAGEY